MSEAAADKNPVDIGDLRRRLGTPGKPISQAELARRCKTAASTIFRYEQNPETQRGPLLVLLQKLDLEANQTEAA